MTPRHTTEWLSQTSDGYYRVYSALGKCEAYHIEALWASPTKLGSAPSIREAQQICEQHAERNVAPA